MDVIARKTGVLSQNEDIDQPDEDIKDPFLKTRKIMYDKVSSTLELIKERTDILRKRGNCDQTIRKNIEINNGFILLDSLYAELLQIFSQQKKKSKRFTSEEMQSRYTSITELKASIEEAKSLHRNNTGTEQKIKTLSDMISEQRLSGRMSSLQGKAPQQLTGEEKAFLQRVEDAKKRQDQALDDIGRRVNELGQRAQHINLSLEEQGEILERVQDAMGENEEELTRLDIKMKAIFRRQKNATFFCRVILVVALIGLAGFLIKSL